jgi:hypothetical protein
MLSAAAPRLGADPRGGFTVTSRLSVVLKGTPDPLTGERKYWACGRLTAALAVGDEIAEVAIEPPPHSGHGGEVATIPGTERSSTRGPVNAKPAAKSARTDVAIASTDAWFEVVKRAFLAAVDSDAATLSACRTALEKRRGGGAQALPWLALLESGEAVALDPAFDPRHAEAPEIIDAGVRAFVGDQAGMLRRCREELGRRAAVKGKPRLVGMASALSILMGETRALGREGREQE